MQIAMIMELYKSLNYKLSKDELKNPYEVEIKISMLQHQKHDLKEND